MARMPGATWLGEHAPIQSNGQRLTMVRYDIVCVHTIVGYAPAHAAHFSTKANGEILQSRDTAYRSGANLEGNHRVIAIENEDHGPAFGSWNTNDGHAVPALTAAQVEANAKILRWAHETHGIPLQLCPDSRPTSRGLAYHRQGIDGNFVGYAYPGRVSGGEKWSTSTGKVCPGDRRIAQRPSILAIAQGDDMPLTITEIEAIAKRSAEWVWGIEKGGWQLQQTANQTRAMVALLQDDEDELKAAIAGIVVDIDEEALAAALAAQGVTTGATPEQVKAALREVLGGLDNPPTQADIQGLV